MKLWHLRTITPAPDAVVAFVVRADTEISARRFASEEPGAEGGFTWLDPTLSTCEELTPESGDAGVIAAEFNAE